MRERLKKLILENDILCHTCGENTDSYCAEYLAEYLIENSVIVSPCKVRDKVYMVTPGGKFHEKKVLGATMSVGVNLYDEIWARWTFVCEGALVFKDLDIGKTVFLTREEAEQALKGAGS